MDMVNLAVQGVVGAFAQLGSVLADGGQGGGQLPAHRQVVDAQDAYVPGDRLAQGQAAQQHLPGQKVVAALDCGAPPLQQPGQMHLQALAQIVGMPGQLPVVLQVVDAQRPEEGPAALLVDIRAQAGAEVADAPVAQLGQIPDGGLHGLVVVDAHLGHLGIVLVVVVQQHRGGAAGAELRCPGVAEGIAQEEAPLVIVAEHIGIVPVLALQLIAEGNQIHLPSVRLRQLAEAGHQAPAEILGPGVGHVLNEHAQPGCLPAAHLPGVAQLHRRLQYAAAHGLADIPGPAEGLGHRPLGYPQPLGNIVHGGHIRHPVSHCFSTL